MKRLLIAISTLLFISPLFGGWLERKAEGWAWYEDIEEPEKEYSESDTLIEPQEKEVTVIPLESAPLSATEEAAKIRKDLEEKLAKAVLDPTEGNIASYMQEQQRWVNQAAKFSLAWTKALLQNPYLDETVIHFPVSQYGIQVQKQVDKERRTKLIQSLIPQYGLFFFYEGQSKNSQAFALVVQEFKKKYGWEVIAISKDGFLLNGFNDNYPNNGIIENLKIEWFPSLFLVNPQTSDIKPVAFGLASLDQIESNIELQFHNQE